MFKQWGVVYRSYTQRRYSKQSRGQGSWPKLAPSTVRRRRKGSNVILRDLGLLFAVVNPTFPGPGSIAERVNGRTVRLGYGGGDRHGTSTVTIAQIAEFHQNGGGNLPQREIIVPPDNPTTKQLSDIAAVNYDDHLNG